MRSPLAHGNEAQPLVMPRRNHVGAFKTVPAIRYRPPQSLLQYFSLTPGMRAHDDVRNRDRLILEREITK